MPSGHARTHHMDRQALCTVSCLLARPGTYNLVLRLNVGLALGKDLRQLFLELTELLVIRQRLNRSDKKIGQKSKSIRSDTEKRRRNRKRMGK